MRNVTLILDDGSRFSGKSFGYEKPVAGEVVFNTAMTGYPESLTDPSYAGQLMTLTYPLVGNYGVPPFTIEPNGLATFMESEKIHAEAIIVSDYSYEYSHWNAVESLGDWLKREKVPGITGIDTRELTKVLREHGVMMGKIVFEEVENGELRVESSMQHDGAQPTLNSQLSTLNFLIVPNPLKALQKLAETHRDKFKIPVIGITGSNGKTIVKEWLHQLLSPDRCIVRSPRSYNSQIGVPLSVWQLSEEAELGIFEAGISEMGEMGALKRMIKPTIGILTNIGGAHQENFFSCRRNAWKS